MSKRLNKTAKLSFYTARKRDGDTQRLSENTGLSTRFVNYVKNGERTINNELANEMYNISRRRMKNSELNFA